MKLHVLALDDIHVHIYTSVNMINRIATKSSDYQAYAMAHIGQQGRCSSGMGIPLNTIPCIATRDYALCTQGETLLK